ncbi:MFS transporter [Georgenia sp. EYE_87]|uniref:MFS transporter n=1 Tax=Georgenia sp. EYE_87 TaxID=2853448 RepID=UPI0020056F2D|nr:MFS transporter [Georgenia sp. EYE_87]MCK6210230.1 MFS transporter [Georgenia sp. EYE_87]
MSRARWGAVAPLILGTTASQALLVVLAPTVVAIGEDLGASVATVGQARSVTAAVAITVSVALSARPGGWPVPRLLRVGGLLAVLACAGVAAAGSLGTFLAAHALVGVAFALLLSGGFAGLGAFEGPERAWAAGQVAAANALAWVVVNPVAAWLTAAWSWRAAQAVPATIAVVALAAARRAVPVAATTAEPQPRGTLTTAGRRPATTPPRPTGAAGAAGRWAPLTERSARRWLVAETAAFTAWTALLTFAGAYFIQRTGADQATVGWLLAAGAGAYLLSSTRSAGLARLLADRTLVAAAAAAMGLLMPLMFTVASTRAGAVAAFCLLGLLAGIRTPASARLGLEQLPGQAAAMMATRTAATQLGYLLGAVAGGALIAASGYRALGLALGVVMLVSAALALRVTARPGAAGAPGGPR